MVSHMLSEWLAIRQLIFLGSHLTVIRREGNFTKQRVFNLLPGVIFGMCLIPAVSKWVYGQHVGSCALCMHNMLEIIILELAQHSNLLVTAWKALYWFKLTDTMMQFPIFTFLIWFMWYCKFLLLFYLKHWKLIIKKVMYFQTCIKANGCL